VAEAELLRPDGPLRVDAGHRPGSPVRDPDTTGVDGERDRLVVCPQRVGPRHDRPLRIHARHNPGQRVRDPHGPAVGDGESGGPGADVTCAPHRTGLRVDAHQLPCRDGPDAARAAGQRGRAPAKWDGAPRVRLRVDAQQGAGRGPRNPEPPAELADVGRARGPDVVGGRVRRARDACQRAVVAVGDPHAAAVGGQRALAVPDPDGLPDRVRLRIDARHGAVPVAGHPDGARRDRDRRRRAVEHGLPAQRAVTGIDLGHCVAAHRRGLRVTFRHEDRDAGGDHEEAPGHDQQAATSERAPAATVGSGRRFAVGGHPALRGGGRRGDLGILLEDGLVEVVELGARFDPQLDERGASVAVGLQRVGLASCPVQREHALGMQALAQWLSDDERIELRDHLGMAAGGQVGIDGQLGRSQPQLLEAADLRRCERLIDEVRERLAAPQRERVPRVRVEQPLKAHGVHVLLVGELQLIAAPVRHDSHPVAVEHLAQARDVELDHLRRARRRRVRPQPLGQAVGRHRPPWLQSEHREDRPLLAGPQLDGPVLEANLERPHQPQIHRRATLTPVER
jgi:hypothetical protein